MCVWDGWWGRYTWEWMLTLAKTPCQIPLELELKAFMSYLSWVLETERRSSIRAAGTPNCWAINTTFGLVLNEHKPDKLSLATPSYISIARAATCV